MAEQIGRALARIADKAPETDSTALSTDAWEGIDLSVLVNLPARLNDTALVAVERIAALPVPVLPPVEEDFLLKCLRTLRLLPSRSDDDLSGELRLNLYRRHFGNYPRDAIAFLTEHATRECRFFPTPRECFDILKRWERTDPEFIASRRARLVATRERQARMDEALGRLRRCEVTQAEVDEWPERWRQIAATRGDLFDDQERLHQIRPHRKPTTEESECPENPSTEE